MSHQPTTTVPKDYKRPTYGNLRRPITSGLYRFSTAQTAGLFVAGAFGVILSFTAGLWRTAGYMLVVGLIAWIASVRDVHGTNYFMRRKEKRMYKKARRRKTNLFRTGLLNVSKSAHTRTKLPNVLGTLKVSVHEDSTRRRFGIIHHSNGNLTVVMALAPSGETLVDEYDFEGKVALWGRMFEDAAQTPGLEWVTTTLQTSPDTGSRIHQEVTSHESAHASELSRQIMRRVVADASGTGVKTSTWLTLTFVPASMNTGINKEERAIKQICTSLPELLVKVAESCSGAVQLLTPGDLTRLVREAWDPEIEAVFDAAAAQGRVVDVEWHEAGPVSFDAGWDRMNHDSGASSSLTMTAPPLNEMLSTRLRSLMAAHSDVPCKRVTMIYKVMDPVKATETSERDVDKASNALKMGKRPTEAKKSVLAKARKTAAEVAEGAALMDFGMVITATVPQGDEVDERLEQARAAAKAAAGSSSIQVRDAFGAQAFTLAMGLPLGIVPESQVLEGSW